MKTLLVVGSAPSLYTDLAAAREKFPGAEVMLVNGACSAVEDAQHVLAGHTDKATFFAKARSDAFPFALPWRLHATWMIRHPVPRDLYPEVTDWWGPEHSSGATSAGKAALIGLSMGFGRIVLCGCPMNGSGYFPGESAGIPQLKACQRIGDATKQEAATIRRYKKKMAELAQTTFKGKVFSMSGYTREVLGAP